MDDGNTEKKPEFNLLERVVRRVVETIATPIHDELELIRKAARETGDFGATVQYPVHTLLDPIGHAVGGELDLVREGTQTGDFRPALSNLAAPLRQPLDDLKAIHDGETVSAEDFVDHTLKAGLTVLGARAGTGLLAKEAKATSSALEVTAQAERTAAEAGEQAASHAPQEAPALPQPAAAEAKASVAPAEAPAAVTSAEPPVWDSSRPFAVPSSTSPRMSRAPARENAGAPSAWMNSRRRAYSEADRASLHPQLPGAMASENGWRGGMSRRGEPPRRGEGGDWRAAPEGGPSGNTLPARAGAHDLVSPAAPQSKNIAASSNSSLPEGVAQAQWIGAEGYAAPIADPPLMIEMRPGADIRPTTKVEPQYVSKNDLQAQMDARSGNAEHRGWRDRRSLASEREQTAEARQAAETAQYQAEAAQREAQALREDASQAHEQRAQAVKEAERQAELTQTAREETAAAQKDADAARAELERSRNNTEARENPSSANDTSAREAQEQMAREAAEREARETARREQEAREAVDNRLGNRGKLSLAQHKQLSDIVTKLRRKGVSETEISLETQAYDDVAKGIKREPKNSPIPQWVEQQYSYGARPTSVRDGILNQTREPLASSASSLPQQPVMPLGTSRGAQLLQFALNKFGGVFSWKGLAWSPVLLSGGLYGLATLFAFEGPQHLGYIAGANTMTDNVMLDHLLVLNPVNGFGPFCSLPKYQQGKALDILERQGSGAETDKAQINRPYREWAEAESRVAPGKTNEEHPCNFDNSFTAYVNWVGRQAGFRDIMPSEPTKSPTASKRPTVDTSKCKIINNEQFCP